ncbi:MAG: type 1 glutamine amidotransferase [Proteobacteria bacterium]|nr:MAG: type 1 glutamine amidotransferase [Pseudomonadota bacterium]
MTKLADKMVAILATDGFEQSELFEPLKALKDAGVKVKILSLKTGQIKGWDEKDWGKEIAVDMKVEDAKVDDFDALVLPGGVINPDALRINKEAVGFIQKFGATGKTIAAICHGPWTLIEADLVEGVTMTSWPSLKMDLTNAGAKWVDKQVAIDKQFITSRNPKDLPAFNQALIDALSKSQAVTTEASAKKPMSKEDSDKNQVRS